MSKFVVILSVLCFSPLLLGSPVDYPTPTTSGDQTATTLCERVYCPPLTCDNPVRMDGECCAVCDAGEEIIIITLKIKKR